MAKSETPTVKKRRVDWRTKVGCKKSKPNPINSPPVKKFLHLDEVESKAKEGDEGDSCGNWGPSISNHRKYEAKLAELEAKLKQAKEEANFYFWKSKELESNIQNLLLQHETSQNAPLPAEGSGENDEATSSECSITQSHTDKWTCSLCWRNEANVAVLPCSHLCPCFDCAVDTNPEKCPVCDTRQTDLLFVRTC